ncbi:MAG: RNA polymerase sigma factor [Lachnospiraceae bacterium]|nr:RNA polymerase sigma factor [Lachnospiraceae bacterium]
MILRIKQGEFNALDELITLYYPEILRYCLWHAPNRTLAEDATQETFLKVIRYSDRYVHKGKFKSFLYQIASNTCIDLRRKKWLTDTSLDELQIEFVYEEKGFEEVIEDIQLRHLVRNLPDESKEIVLLRFGQDLTIREISEIVDQPLRTVQSRLHSALKQIKKEIRKEENNGEH